MNETYNIQEELVGFSLEGIRGIIFDFNGTLYWDENENREAWNRTAVMIRGRELSDSEFGTLNGRTDRETVLYFLPEASDDLVAQWSDRKERIYKEICLGNNPELSPGAREMLEMVKRAGIPMAIASSAPRVNMDWYVPYFNLLSYFPAERIIAGRDDIPSKPDGTIFRIAAESLGLSAGDTVIFEDSRSGVLAAMDSGCRNIIRIRGPHGKDIGIDGIREVFSFRALLDSSLL